MNESVLPYRRLLALTEISPDLSADLRRLYTLVSFAWEHDTGGLVAYEIAQALIHDGAALTRLNDVDLLHHHFDVTWCGCGVPKSAWHWSIHDYHRLVSGYWRAAHGVATH